MAPSGLLAQWLRFYGPILPAHAASVFGLTRERLDALLEDLAAQEVVVLDRMAAGSEEVLLCDRENLEALLRISRARARPEVKTLPVEMLAPFVARRQGLLPQGEGPEHMKAVLEKLFGVSLPASSWEEEVFPARLRGYRTQWLDALLDGTQLLWLGCGKGRISFSFPADVELFAGEATRRAAPVTLRRRCFPRPRAVTPSGTSLPPAAFPPRSLRGGCGTLHGKASPPTIHSPRCGGESAMIFVAEEATREGGRKASASPQLRPLEDFPGRAAGFWFRIPRETAERDALDEEEITRDRVRQVLQRYGVVFRELLETELPPLRWPRLFRSLRLMEFSGEVVTGRFFDGIRGLQFALPPVFEELAVRTHGG